MDDDKLTYEDVKSMQFLEMVLAETLRKYLPVVRFSAEDKAILLLLVFYLSLELDTQLHCHEICFIGDCSYIQRKGLAIQDRRQNGTHNDQDQAIDYHFTLFSHV
uniref:Cytochrome P450 n=1 Tax=Strigamia maritima TaxID=126957 RepID=T1JEF9_STRMM